MNAYTEAARCLLNLEEEKGRMLDTEEREVIDSIIKNLTASKGRLKTEAMRGYWYIRPGHESVRISGLGPIEIEVDLSKSGSDSRGTLYESLPAPFETFTIDRVEEHGGEGYGQQSIVIAVCETGTNKEAEIQVEIDMTTGGFEESSLTDWEITELDE